jgi:hypothetical protein
MHPARPPGSGEAGHALTRGPLGLDAVDSSAANVPDPVAKSLPIRVPALGNAPDGSLTTTVTYTDTTATARSSSGNTVRLSNGFVFRLRTCVAYHLHGTVPVYRYAERTVDTRANTESVVTRVPTVTLADQPRPTSQPWGYFKAYAEVLYQAGSSWPLIAHSWPDNGLQGAGIVVAARGQMAGCPAG